MKKVLSTSTLIALMAVWLACSTGVVLIIGLVAAGPNTRAVILMGSGLVVVWVGLGGTVMRVFREPVSNFVRSVPVDWRLKFVLFATLLALAEEAVTTTMTNLAPVFGVPLGAAYITASANYLDVVCLHSVVVFIPMFVAWARVLSRCDFSPNTVFLLFGLTGTLAEAMYGGAQAFVEFGMWFFVYGLMIYLPAYSVPSDRGARSPRWWHYPLAVLLPFVLAIPVAIVVSTLHPVDVHFPPIPPDS